MSDEESSENGDFSCSEDEWQPDEERSSSTENESGNELQAEDSTDNNRKRSRKKITENLSCSKTSLSRRKKSQNLRTRMFNKYKPTPKSVNSPSINSNLSYVLEKSQFKKKKISSTQNTEESDSSGDDYLVHPKDIDLKSSFFDIPVKDPENEQAPEFDCNAGLRLSDSEGEEEGDFEDVKEEIVVDEKLPVNSLKSMINQSSGSSLKHLHEYALKLESAKEHLRGLKSEPVKTEQNINVSQLLAMGEPNQIKLEGSTSRKRKKADSESDTDWEEVKDAKIQSNIPNKEIIQVTVQLQDKRQEKKPVDVDAVIKRKLNRVIKETQLSFHKVSLLCHIGHAIYANKVLNNPSLMEKALMLLPNKICYPSGRTEIKYFESIAKWYKTAIAIKSDKMYSYFRTRPKLPISLAIQIKYKAAICKKDFVLIFITLLRAMGIQCRMVMHLVPLPIRPSQKDLCRITMKKEENKPSKIKKEKAVRLNKSSNSKEHQNSTAAAKDPKVNKKVASESQKPASKQNLPCSSSQQKDKREKKIQNTNQQVETEPKMNIRHKKSEKLDDIGITKDKPKKATTNRQPQRNVVSNQKDHVVESLSSEIKKPEKCVKKLAKKVAMSTTCQEAETSPYFVKQNINENKKEMIVETVSSSTRVGRALRSQTKQQKNVLKVTSIPQLDGNEDTRKKISKRSRGRKENFKLPKDHPDPPSDSEEEFMPSPPKKVRASSSTNKKNSTIKQIKKEKRVLSTDEDSDTEKKVKKNSMDIWVEAFAEEEDQWVTIDLFSGKVHCIDSIRKAATSPIAYVFACNNDNTLKDVSARYCPQWHTVTRKLRIEQEWLDEALKPYVAKRKSARDKKEDRELNKIHMDKPLPTTISEYKNHPLYVLERHLLKFEAIYPPNALTLGFVRGEPVYARECVHCLHSREIWLKSARVVKPGQQPYKIVKARPKWDRLTNSVIKDLPLEIFGYWQTMQYVPPTAENGIVPRNAYGNVELFKKCMLPKKTVHLQLPGLNRVCKKLKIDCAPAVVGFDFHQGSCHPLLDGFVVCEEFSDQVVAAWYKDQEEAVEREKQKYQQRVYGNWKKLIKGLFIREKLKRKYNFEGLHNQPNEKIKKSKK